MGKGGGGYFGGTRGSRENYTTTSSNMPTRGEPNSTIIRVDKNGNPISKRHYDSDGRAKEDIDYTDHGNPKTHPKAPHKHTWNWDNPEKPVRSKYDE